jgi:hypothetical protein
MWKEGCQRHFGEDDQVAATAMTFLQKRDKPLDDILPRFAAVDRSKLRCADGKMPGHSSSLNKQSALALEKASSAL